MKHHVGVGLLLLAACKTAAAPPPTELAPTLFALDQQVAPGPLAIDRLRADADAERRFRASPDDPEAAWRWARALYLRSLLAPSDEQAELAARCERELGSILEGSDLAEAHYYRALCWGARAQARPLEGLPLVRRMLSAAERAAALDPSCEHGGPERLLGGLYLRAPAWPVSIGDPEQALEHLAKAVALDPRWPENHLLLAEALWNDERPLEARRALELAEATLKGLNAPGWRPIFEAQLEALKVKWAQPKQIR